MHIHIFRTLRERTYLKNSKIMVVLRTVILNGLIKLYSWKFCSLQTIIYTFSIFHVTEQSCSFFALSKNVYFCIGEECRYLFNKWVRKISISTRTKLVEVMEFQLSSFKSWKITLWTCCTQYASKFGKLSSGHRTGKGPFSFQSQRKAMPKNAQTTTQLHSPHTQ